MSKRQEKKPFFLKFRRWLKGIFNCKRCGRTFYIMSFGYGEAICPDCYKGEKDFLFYDEGYWINRVTSRRSTAEASSKEHAITSDQAQKPLQRIPAS